ncbi:FxsA family protein [Sneathiella chungangensis]|uniref:FxsA family protein n=1 Tax=Sneathiella chungangensis TaxID=1418234 RepID=A0A845MM52_9PROT|nr:FxsA family protein [Sneathiella chungangensis]MZR24057.1 FxsA family protein [Sneathiella chungangensis]
MALLFLAALIGIPLIEILVFVKVGGEIGALNTVIITIATALIGVALIRIQGLGVLMRARATLDRQETPVHEIFEGIFLALAGLFLIIPGFVTDTIGFLLLIPPLRRMLAAYMARHSTFVAANVRRPGGSPRGTVIDGDYEVVDEDALSIETTRKPNPDSPWSKEK